MKELILRNCENVFYKQDRKRKYSAYYDPKNNNLIVFSPFDDCDIESVCNSIRESAYIYLTSVLNTQNNVVVSWSQVSGTTSDYTIYYNMPIDELKNKSYKEIWEYIYSLNIQSDVTSYKYTEVKNNIEYVIELE